MKNNMIAGSKSGNVTGVSRPTLVLFFIVDTSAGMEGSRINSVNVAIEALLLRLIELSEHAYVEIKIALLEFSTGAHWVIGADHPEDPLGCQFQHFTASGSSDLGRALEELNKKLSQKTFIKEERVERRCYLAPGIFFFTEGSPTDDWQTALESLRKNKWYQKAMRIGVAIGNDADMQILESITGSSELVTRVTDPKQLCSLLRSIELSDPLVEREGLPDGDLDELDANQQAMANALSYVELDDMTDDDWLCGFDDW